MSINTSMDTITVENVTYDVERSNIDYGEKLTLSIDGEPVFEGLEATLGYDEFGHVHDNPREWDNVGTMAVSYRGYKLGDEDISKIDFEIECAHCYGHGTLAHLNDQACALCKGTGYHTLNPVDYFKQERGARVVIGLTVYEHSGLTMRAGDVTLPWDTDRWDTSFVGFIFDTPEGIKQCIGDNATDEQIEKALRSEVATYASFLEGDITFYSVEDDETGYHESCGGYIGDHKQCESECFESLEQAIIARLAENKERAHWQARDVNTI